MTYESCIATIKKVAGVELTDEDLERLVEQLVRRKAGIQRRGARTASDADAMRQAARELGAEARQAAAIEQRNALLNLKARVARRGRIQDAPSPVLGIQAEIHGINTPVRGGRFSAEAEGKALANIYQSGVVNEFERAGLLQIARRGDLESQWTRELFELSKGADGKPGVSGSKEAQAIAEILHRYQALAKQDMNRAGASVGDYAGYIARTAHDPDKIRAAGFDTWRQAILAGLDRDRTFEDVADPGKFLKSVYTALITGVHLTEEGARGFKDPAFTGPGNLAKRLSQERVLHFRDADAWLAYQRQYGESNALAAVMNSLNRAARSTALMRRWGTNPRAEFEGDLRYLQETLRDQDPAAVIKLREAQQDLQNRFDYLDGTANMPANRLGARVGSAVRVIESMAKLGGVAFTHLSSGVTKAAELRYHGIGLLQGYGDFLASFLRGRGAGETREVMDLLGAGVEGMQRDILSRFQPDDTVPGTLSKAATTFFRWSGLTYLMNAQKAGAEFVMARHLGSLLDREHGELPAETQRLLKLYGIDPAHWEMLRQAPDPKSIDGRAFLTPDAAHRIDAGALEAHLRETGAIADEASPQTIGGRMDALREELALKVHAMYHDIAERSIVTPGIPEKALLLGGTRPGTLWGEALRFIVQFKQWPVAAVRQGLGREIYGGQDKLTAAGGLVHMALGSVIMGYLAMSLKDLAKGRHPRDPLDVKTWAAALMQGGGAGIFGDFLFGEYNRFGQNFSETMLGPVLGQGVNTALDLWNRAKNGQDLKPEALRAVLDNTPFINLFYTRLALNYLFLYQVQEALNPGYLRRFERRVQQQNNQTFWLRPSEAAR